MVTDLSPYRRLASALRNHSIGTGQVIAVLAPNTPVSYETHFGVPMCGAVLNTVNIRLDAQTVSFLLGHSVASAVIVDQEIYPLLQDTLCRLGEKSVQPLINIVRDPAYDARNFDLAIHDGRVIEYEEFLGSGDAKYKWQPLSDEWQSIMLDYTSGTTSDPKRIVLSHRGTYVGSIRPSLAWDMGQKTLYLLTLPIFHCNGWCYTWATGAHADTNVCLR